MSERSGGVEAALRAIQEQLAVLTERVAALEAAAQSPVLPAVSANGVSANGVPAGGASANGVSAGAAAPVAAEPEGLSEETLLVISAAIAAYLGKKAHIRQIRLVNSTTWAQQGRVGIHTSHALAVHSRSGAGS